MSLPQKADRAPSKQGRPWTYLIAPYPLCQSSCSLLCFSLFPSGLFLGFVQFPFFPDPLLLCQSLPFIFLCLSACPRVPKIVISMVLFSLLPWSHIESDQLLTASTSNLVQVPWRSTGTSQTPQEIQKTFSLSVRAEVERMRVQAPKLLLSPASQLLFPLQPGLLLLCLAHPL